MSIQSGHPFLRFNRAGPHGVQGLTLVPKAFLAGFDITGTGVDDFWTIPAGTFIQQVILNVETGLDEGATVEVGLDDNADAFIDTADFTDANAEAYATNIGSSNADYPKGLYVSASDLMRLTVAGTTAPTVGRVRVLVTYWELDAAEANPGLHFDKEI